MATPLALNTTTEQNLLDLIKAEIHEGKIIEYKREIALATSEQKRKLLRSIASFANASGGELIFGMSAEKGKPIEIRALPDFEPDRDVRILRDIVRAHIEPPLFGVELQPVSIRGGWALVLRVARSWNPPHMVTFEGDNRFYTRDANGCVPMNIPEIREAFFAGKTVKERIQQHRFQRLNGIRSGEFPLTLPSEAKAVFHAFPFRSFAEDYHFDLGVLDHPDLHPPTNWRSCGLTYDIDGVYGNETRDDGKCGNYIFVSHSGCIETLTTANLPSRNGKFIANPSFEKQFINFMPRCINILRKLQIDPPIALALTLLEVNGYVLYSGPRTELWIMGARPIRQRDLILPTATVTSYDQSTPKMLKPIFDALWRSCGLKQSFNYDKDENFTDRSWD